MVPSKDSKEILHHTNSIIINLYHGNHISITTDSVGSVIKKVEIKIIHKSNKSKKHNLSLTDVVKS